MPRYNTNIDRVLSTQEAELIYKEARTLEDRALVSIAWLTGGRTNEIRLLKRKDVTISPDFVELKLFTEKLRLGSGRFKVKKRELVYKMSPNIFLGAIIDYCLIIGNPEEFLFSCSDRTLLTRIGDMSRRALGEALTFNHFRHSRMTLEASKGTGLDGLMYFKGASDVRSVSTYLHARKVPVDLEKE